MLRKLLFPALCIAIQSFSYDISVRAMKTDLDQIDPANFTISPQTQNGMGMNFSSLGSFEEAFIKDCREVDLAESQHVPRILFLGEAYGRLPLRILKETGMGAGGSDLLVNDLSASNLKPLERKLESMRESKSLTDQQAAARVSLFVGDCLDLQENEEFMQQTHGQVDLIMCANMLHFFDGEQVLKFFTNTFNWLKPGGKAYLFTQSRTKDFTRDEILKAGDSGLSYMYIKACHTIQEAAQRDPSILFPGLIQDAWLLNKTPTLNFILGEKPNGLGMMNTIPETTLQRVSSEMGFEIINQTFYSLERSEKGDKVPEDRQGHYCGLVLKKPENYAGGPLTREKLNSHFVQNCLEASTQMKTFIETRLNFLPGYPFVAEKPQDENK